MSYAQLDLWLELHQWFNYTPDDEDAEDDGLSAAQRGRNAFFHLD